MIYSPTKPGISTRIDWSDPLSQGLVGCWLFNEGGGKQAVNSARQISNVVSSTASLNSNGLVSSTDTSGFPLTVVPNLTLPNSAGWTISTRFKCTSTGMLIGSCSAGVNCFIWISSATNIKLRQQDADTDITVRTMTDGKWHTLSLSVLGTSASFHIDNIKYTGTTTSAKNFLPWYIGNGYDNSSYNFQGTIGHFILYNRALNANEIRQLHELTAGW